MKCSISVVSRVKKKEKIIINSQENVILTDIIESEMANWLDYDELICWISRNKVLNKVW